MLNSHNTVKFICRADRLNKSEGNGENERVRESVNKQKRSERVPEYYHLLEGSTEESG